MNVFFMFLPLLLLLALFFLDGFLPYRKASGKNHPK